MKTIKRLMLEKHLTQKEVADYVGVTQQAVQRWCATDVLPRTKEKLEKLAKILGVSPSILAFSENGSILDDDGYVLIPSIDISVSCGGGSDITQKRPLVRLIKVSTEWIRIHTPFVNHENLNILTAEGNSMMPTIKDGDLVFIDITQKEVRSDSLYVFVYRDELFLKRIQRLGTALRIISDNSIYPPFEIAGQELDAVKVIGKVCAVANMNNI